MSCHAYVNDVLCVPAMRNNLISLGQLLEKWYNMKMENRILTVLDAINTFILKAPLSSDKAFKIQINSGMYECLVAAIKDVTGCGI